jgi:hypothetical protein
MPGFPSHPDQCTQLYCKIDAENIVDFLTYNSEYKGVIPCPQQTQIGHTFNGTTFQVDTKVPICFRPPVDPRDEMISAMKADIATLHASLSQAITAINKLKSNQ